MRLSDAQVGDYLKVINEQYYSSYISSNGLMGKIGRIYFKSTQFFHIKVNRNDGIKHFYAVHPDEVELWIPN
jgi:hypothetical protein